MEVDGHAVLRAVSTDGHRLARVEIPAPEGSADMPGIIVPRKAVAEIQKLIEDPAAEVAIELSTTKIRLTFGDVVLTTKLIDGTFPDYARVIPAGNDKHLMVEKAPFAAGGRPRLDHLVRARPRREARHRGRQADARASTTRIRARPPRSSTSTTTPRRSISASTPATCSTSPTSSTTTRRC